MPSLREGSTSLLFTDALHGSEIARLDPIPLSLESLPFQIVRPHTGLLQIGGLNSQAYTNKLKIQQIERQHQSAKEIDTYI